MQIKVIITEATYPLRRAILRPQQKAEQVVFTGDNVKTTFHLGMFEGERLISIVSLYKKTAEFLDSKSAWQLRGMATLEACQGKGYGTQLISAAEKEIKSRLGEIIWCNAREVAITFYEKAGFTIHGKSFEIEDVGLHYVMWKKLEA